MLTYVRTNIFESPAQVIVNTVNTVGVMGKGIAKDFKEIYPDMFDEYRNLCEQRILEVGKLWIYKTSNKWVLNFPTKKHWKSPSKLEYIESGLIKFVNSYAEKGITSISFPLLGCGNGGLNWEKEVQPLMEKYLRPLPIDIFIHLAFDKNQVKEHLNIEGTRKWLRSHPNLLSFNEFWDDIFELVSKGISLPDGTFVDFMQIEGEKVAVFRKDENSVIVTEEQMMDLWKYVRTVGYCSKQGLPSGLFELGSAIFNLLSELPYIEPVILGSNENELQKGIRLIPYLANEEKRMTEDLVNVPKE
ncbi:macro domain-containing protein [Paenibacillaceae bacterium WGS1546]|uniref:macro domain-containing protein n=1 Tax=Cohnella sp. WGS1546 TaxID=3366810 RepID=UPI00372D1E63